MSWIHILSNQSKMQHNFKIEGKPKSWKMKRGGVGEIGRKSYKPRVSTAVQSNRPKSKVHTGSTVRLRYEEGGGGPRIGGRFSGHNGGNANEANASEEEALGERNSKEVSCPRGCTESDAKSTA